MTPPRESRVAFRFAFLARHVRVLAVFFACQYVISAGTIFSEVPREVINRQPKYSGFKIKLAVGATIQESEHDEHLMFKYIWDIAVDSAGDIIVLDDKIVSKFSPIGEFISYIGSIGQGPGEFLSPWKIFISSSDILYINDQGHSIVSFFPSGKGFGLVRLSAPVPGFPLGMRSFVVDREGSFYHFVRDYDDSAPTTKLVKVDSSGKREKTIAVVPEGDVVVKGSAIGGVLGGVQHAYSQENLLCAVPNKQLCFATNTEYRISILDSQGNVSTILRKAESPKMISARERAHIGNGPDFVYPPHRPFIRSILADEKGRIWVIKRKSVLSTDANWEIDVFSNDGFYLFHFYLPCVPAVIRNGQIYSIIQSETSRVRIQCFKIVNYSEMKPS